MGRGCRIMSNCYIPSRTWLGDFVFMGPGVTITNSRYPGRLPDLPTARGPTIEDGVMIGGGVTPPARPLRCGGRRPWSPDP